MDSVRLAGQNFLSPDQADGGIEEFVGGIADGVREASAESERESFAVEEEIAVAEMDSRDASFGAKDSGEGCLVETQKGLRCGTEAIVDFVVQGIEFLFRGAFGQAAMEEDPLRIRIHVGMREIGSGGIVEFRIGGCRTEREEGKIGFDVDQKRRFDALELSDCPAQELAIEGKADCGDMTALFGTEQISGAADGEIAQGESDTRTETRGGLERFEPFLCVGRQRVQGRGQEVGIGLHGAATDAAAKLVEIGDAEPIGPIDQDGIGAGDVDAVFDNGGGEKECK